MEEFNRLLSEYKNQYLQFLSSGDIKYKDAYQNVMKGIEDAISRKRQEVDSQKSAMGHFLESYKKDNQALGDTYNGARGLAKDAQALHDEYQTSKNRYDSWTEDPNVPKGPVIDVSNGYSIMLRFGIFLILIPVLIFVGWLGGGGSHIADPSIRYISSPQPSPFFGPMAIHNR